MMNLVGRLRFFVGAAIGPTGWPRFRFTGRFMVGVGLGGVDSLAIGGAVSTKVDVAVGFSKLFFW